MPRALFLFSVRIVCSSKITLWLTMFVHCPLHILTFNLTGPLEVILFYYSKGTKVSTNCIKGCKGLSDFLNQKLFPLAGGSRKQPLKFSYYFKKKTLNVFYPFFLMLNHESSLSSLSKISNVYS
jgi:hypothetical protein